MSNNERLAIAHKMYNKAKCLFAQEQHAEKVELLEECVRISKQIPGRSAKGLFIEGNMDLARALVESNNLFEADQLITTAMEALDGYCRSNDVYVSIVRGHAAGIKFLIKDYQAACRLISMSIAIAEPFYGKNNIMMSGRYLLAGRIAKAQGELDRAEEFLLWALNLKRRHCGRLNVEHCEICLDLSNVERLRGDIDGEIEWLEEAIENAKWTLGEGHPAVRRLYSAVESIHKRK